MPQVRPRFDDANRNRSDGIQRGQLVEGRVRLKGVSPLSWRSLQPWTINLSEPNAQPILLPPYHTAMSVHLVLVENQLEFMRNVRCVWNLQGGSHFRKISDDATVRAAFKFNDCTFKDAASFCRSLFAHSAAPFLVRFMHAFRSGRVRKAS